MDIKRWISAIVVCLAAPLLHGLTPHHISILSAESDRRFKSIDDESLCPVEISPRSILLKVGHIHEVTVTGPDGAYQWTSSNPNVATVEVADSTERRAWIKGRGIGTSDLTITIVHNGHPETATIRVRGIARRHTIIAWIDRNRVIPSDIAPTANSALKDALSTKRGCFTEMIRWRMNQRGHVRSRSTEDILYAKAFLIHETANDPPPAKLTSEFLKDKKNYKLWNDFQVDDRRAVLIGRAIAGRTPFPCGILPASWEGEVSQTENATVAWNPSGTMQSLINEARVGEDARIVEHAIDPKGTGTPWIWSIIGFDKIGAAGVHMQIFPTYSVYRDGVVCGRWSQAELKRFVTGTGMSELKRSDADRYTPRDWAEPCSAH